MHLESPRSHAQNTVVSAVTKHPLPLDARMTINLNKS
jgi:hypothetical protein